jgi:superfamily I DNA/RNA helicase
MGIDLDNSDAKWKAWTIIEAVRNLVSLCKTNLLEGTEEDIDYLTDYHDMELNGSRREVVDLVPQVLDLCTKPQEDRRMDFDDMIWLPVKLQLPAVKYDLLLTDESQDLNKCQQELDFRSGKRLVFCGDKHQAIYGFAGADAEAIENLENRLLSSPQGAVLLPLTVTRRCGKAIVEEAKKIVHEFEAHESNGEGKVSQGSYNVKGTGGGNDYTTMVSDGDMIICRVNAPLVSQCFRFLKVGRKATIQGKDVIKGLMSTIKKTKAETTPEFIEALDRWHEQQRGLELKSRHVSENKLIALQDRVDCLRVFAEDTTKVSEIVAKIESVFVDDTNVQGIKLSSIHKAKGLEAHRVFLIEPPGATVPHPMAKTAWQKKQEWNLKYVAITSDIEELVFFK